MDKALKQRLVGASVLIVLAVIVLPMLLGGRSERLQQESAQIELPQKPEEMSFDTRRFPVGIPDKPQAEAADLSSEQSSATQTDDQEPLIDVVKDAGPMVDDGSESVATGNDPEAAVTNIEKPPAVTTVVIEPTVNKEDPMSLPVAPTPVASSGETPRYLVQVASFSSEKRANALAGDLRAARMTVVMDVVDRTAGRLHRVRVGPFVERADADAAVARIKAQINDLSPRVVDMRPTDSSPVTVPSDPLVRWVVQVGSYANAGSADAQVAKLRLAGLSAFSEKVTSAEGLSYKVRIGPEVSLEKAKQLKAKIKADHQIDGFVTTQ
jgi:DedD protein